MRLRAQSSRHAASLNLRWYQLAHMKQHLILTAAAALLWNILAVQPAVAGERILYKSVLPDGRVQYADEPIGGAKAVEKIRVEPHPANEKDAQAARRALALSRAQLLRDIDARNARLAELEHLIDRQYVRLQDVQVQREQGAAVGEGDRQGRRMTPRYGERQRQLAAAVQQETMRLDALLRERSQLQF